MSTKSRLLHDSLQKRGEAITLTRDVMDEDRNYSSASVVCLARLVPVTNQPADLVGNIDLYRNSLVLSNEEILNESWPGPPRQGDKVQFRTQEIIVDAVVTLDDGEGPARHELYFKAL